MKPYRYQPSRFNFNRFCHRAVSLIRPEKHVNVHPMITIPQLVVFPDTSIYEGHLNITTMIAGGAAAVIAKASQGTVEDVQFAATWSNARGRLPRGAYLFYDPTVSPTAHVNKFTSLLAGDPGELPLVVDWEAAWSGPYTGWSNLYAVLEGLKANFPGRRIAIYTGYFFWLDHSPNPITQPASLAYFGQYDLWLAWYAPANLVKIPAPWTDLKFWQFTDSGPGAQYGTQSGAVDLNYYNGTPTQFAAEFGGSVPPPAPPPPGGTMATKVTVNAGAIANLKDMVTSAILHVAQPGESVYGTLSLTGTDVTGFVHYYDAAGVQHPLAVSDSTKGAKVSIGSNVTVLNNVTEPGNTPPPPPPPAPAYIATVSLNVNGQVLLPKSINSDGTVNLG